MSEREQAILGAVCFLFGGALLATFAPAMGALRPELGIFYLVVAALCGPLALVDLVCAVRAKA